MDGIDYVFWLDGECFWLLLNLAVIEKSDSFDLTILFASYTV